jgi:YidC/Oxa1 family membrane protein insertase
VELEIQERYEKMKQGKGFLIGLAVFLAGFVLCCAILITNSGLFSPGFANRCILLHSVEERSDTRHEIRDTRYAASDEQQKTSDEQDISIKMIKPVTETNEPEGVDWNKFVAVGGAEQTVIIGAKDPCTEDPQKGFKFQLELNSLGASIKKVTFSDGGGKGFDDLDYKNPKPLVLLKPVKKAGDSIMTMANREFILISRNVQFALDKMFWEYLGTEKLNDGGEKAYFQATIIANMLPIIRITKTYSVKPGNYLVDCDINVENVAESELRYRFNINGPVGIDNEGYRGDSRKAVGCFAGSKGEIFTVAKKADELKKSDQPTNIDSKAANFLWLAVTNKYFASILVPIPSEQNKYCDWIIEKNGSYYDPDNEKGSGDETIAVHLGTKTNTIKAGEKNSYKFEFFCGPKDNKLFDKTPRFRELGFIYVIDFMSCCCPAKLIRPLAFGILWLMEWLHNFIHNYGLVIIILVFVVRLILHPLTKKGQVSMSKMGKLAPKVEQLKKKYADDKAELNKQVMALYREQGASPFMGMIPMFIQMPIWIALYSAIDASVSLRGAEFLPFWITNLSAPDALFRFPAVTIPWFGWTVSSFNLLPILMGVAFYLQQKLTPTQGTASTNPQLAQQQKMMMIMMPILFPLMLYSAPSGLNLYIMASTFAGAVEQYVIKKHIKKKEEAEEKGLVPATSKTGGKAKKKKPKPFFKKYT